VYGVPVFKYLVRARVCRRHPTPTIMLGAQALRTKQKADKKDKEKKLQKREHAHRYGLG
jgi:hypothetical protein